MTEIVAKLAIWARDALLFEDNLIRDGIRRNRAMFPNPEKELGILRINNERYYQFTIARHLLAACPYSVKVEFNDHDLALFDAPQGKTPPLAIIEMKRWMSKSGESEIGFSSPPPERSRRHGRTSEMAA